MVFDNLFGDVQAQTGPALALLGCKVRVENFGNLLRLDAVTGVGDPNVDVEILSDTTNFDLSFAFGRSLNRINNDILDCAGDLYGIAFNDAVLVGQTASYLDTGFLRHRSDAFHDFTHNVGD